MAKRPVITPVAAGDLSLPINNNLNRIAESFDNTLSRDGSTPNQMEADLDLNSNDLLNVNVINAEALYLRGEEVVTSVDVDEAVARAEAAAEEAQEAAEQVEGMQGDIDLALANSQEALDAVEELREVAVVDPHSLGARGFTYQEMIDLNGAGMGEAAAANDSAFTQAVAILDARGGGVIQWKGLIYPFSNTLARGSNMFVRGVGPGRYLPQSAADKFFDGTIFLAYGTGPKVHTFAGITSGELNGGWRPNPDNPSEVFKLWTAYNSDAVGATPASLKPYSVFILDDLADGSGGWEDIRALPWRGTNGVTEYLNPAAPVWGADWDFGYVIKNSEYVETRRLNCLGPWRQTGHTLVICESPSGRFSRAERNLVENCLFEGRIGGMVRSYDVWKAVATTSDSVSIAWTSEHYWTSSGTFRGSDGGVYTYTGLSLVGSNLVFSGVTPSPAGISHIRHGSSGLANSMYRDCMFFDLRPQDGTTAQSKGIASSGFEISGFPLRGLKFENSKFHTRGSVIAHFHAVADLTMISHQFEGGGFVLASPAAASQVWGPQATYETRGLRIVESNGLSDNTDLRLFAPRNGLVTELQLSPRSDMSGDFQILPLLGKSVILPPPYLPYVTRAAAELATVPAVAQYINVAGLGYKRDPAGDALTTAGGVTWSPLGVATPQHFGATGTGSGDDGEAIRKTVALHGYLPSGTYRITSTVNLSARLLRGDPSGKTTIILDNLAGANGFTFLTPGSFGNTIGAVDVEFVIRGSNCGIVLACPVNSGNYFTWFTRIQMERLYFRGDVRNTDAHGFTWNYGASSYIRLGDCQGCTVEKVVIQGSFDIASDPAGQFVSKGITTQANGGILSARISNIEIGSVHTGIEIGARTFYTLDNYDLMSCYDGLIEVGPNQFSEPKIGKGNINIQRKGISLLGTNARDIIGVTIRRHANGWAGATNEWVGIETNGTQEFSINGCHIETAYTDTSNGAIAIKCIGGGAARIGNNTFGDNLTACYSLSNVVGVDIRGDTINSATTIVYADLTANTRYANFARPRFNPTVAQNLLQVDGTIGNTVRTDFNGRTDLNPPGPYADDTAAATAGVAVGQLYRLTGGSIAWRQV